jgi:hypothetical protein
VPEQAAPANGIEHADGQALRGTFLAAATVDDGDQPAAEPGRLDDVPETLGSDAARYA